MKRIGLCVGVQHYTKLYRSIFNILKQHKDTFKFGRRFFFFIQEWSDFFPIIEDKSPKSDMELTDLATDECLSNLVRSCSVSRAKGNVSPCQLL